MLRQNRGAVVVWSVKPTNSTLASGGIRPRLIALVTGVGFSGILMLIVALGSQPMSAPQPQENVHEAPATSRVDDGGTVPPRHSMPGSITSSEESAREANALLAAAAEATARYQDLARAQDDDYRPVTGVLTGSAMHWVSQHALEDDGFDVTRPEVLLYDEIAGERLELVGVAYLLPQRSAGEAPPTAFGPLAHWHAHRYRWPCLTGRTEGPRSPSIAPTLIVNPAAISSSRRGSGCCTCGSSAPVPTASSVR
jgi:hypothetical protein